VNGRRRRSAVVGVPWENPPADSPAYPTWEESCRTGSRASVSDPNRRRRGAHWVLGALLFESLWRSAQPRMLSGEGPRADPPRLPHSLRCGSPRGPAVSVKRGLITCFLPAGPPREARRHRRAAAKGKSRRINRGRRVLLLVAAKATTSRSVRGRPSNPSSLVHISTPIHRLIHNPP